MGMFQLCRNGMICIVKGFRPCSSAAYRQLSNMNFSTTAFTKADNYSSNEVVLADAEIISAADPASYTAQQITQTVDLAVKLQSQGQFGMNLASQRLMRIMASYNNWLVPMIHFKQNPDPLAFIATTDNEVSGQPHYKNRIICSDKLHWNR